MIGKLPSLPPKQFGPTSPITKSVAVPGTSSTRSSATARSKPVSASATTQHSPMKALSPSKRLNAPTSATVGSPRKKPTTSRRSNFNSNACITPVNALQLRNDRLGALVRELCSTFSDAESWEEFVNAFRGPSYLASGLEDIDHPATELLRKWRDEGAPADTSSPPWTLEQKDQCMERGCHPSATKQAPFLRDEMAEFIENKFWVALPYKLVRHLECWRYVRHMGQVCALHWTTRHN